jgi:hypothetical protein
MGYDLYVTRKRDYGDKKGARITLEEWLALLDRDPELTPCNGTEMPHAAWWSEPGEYRCWLDYKKGNLYAKNPTPEFIDKMAQIAKVLSGKVQGQDGEVYPGNGQPPHDE